MALRKLEPRKAEKSSKESERVLTSPTPGEAKPAEHDDVEEQLHREVEKEIRAESSNLSKALIAGAKQGRSGESKLMYQLAKKKPRKEPVKKPWSMAKQFAREPQWTGPLDEEDGESGREELKPE